MITKYEYRDGQICITMRNPNTQEDMVMAKKATPEEWAETQDHLMRSGWRVAYWITSVSSMDMWPARTADLNLMSIRDL